MLKDIDLPGRQVRLRSTIVEDGPALLKIRRTNEVRQRWRGTDFEAEFASDLDDDELVLLTVEFNGSVVGLIQFSEEQDPDYRHASIDVYIDPAEHRRGFATDAIKTLVDFLFDQRGHHRLTIDPAADNEAAIKSYAAVGFRRVGIMRAYERQADGTWADGLLMDMVPCDRT